MQLKDVQIYDRVLVWLDIGPTYNSMMVSNHNGKSIQVPCTVLKQTAGATIIGWKAGEIHPNDPSSSNVARTITDDWRNIGIVFACEYGSHCYCEFIKNTPAPKMLKKNYGNECPCGIHPTMCDYHR